VPCELAGQTVSTRLYPNRLAIVFDQAVAAEHERLADLRVARVLMYDYFSSLRLQSREE
jgi:hypothetical protein